MVHIKLNVIYNDILIFILTSPIKDFLFLETDSFMFSSISNPNNLMQDFNTGKFHSRNEIVS